MEVLLFSECPTRDYYRALIHLEKQGKINLKFIDSRLIYLCFLFIYSRVGFLRKLGARFGKPLNVKEVPFRTIIDSFIGYFRLLVTGKKIVVLFAPYGIMGVYLSLLKLLNRDMVFMTSWPYWDGSRYVHKGFKVFWKYFLKGVEVVTISETAKNNLKSFTTKSVQIPHSVDLDTFQVGRKQGFKVLFVGRLIEEKGLKDIVKFAKKLKDVEFVFVGGGPLASYFESLDMDNVSYLGVVRDRKKLARIFSSASVFVLNSYAVDGWEELYGIVLLEALAAGTMVIGSDCVGPKEIISSEYGILVKQKSYSQLLKAVKWCRDNPKKVKAMGKKGRKFVESKYDVEDLAEKWYGVLSKGL